MITITMILLLQQQQLLRIRYSSSMFRPWQPKYDT